MKKDQNLSDNIPQTTLLILMYLVQEGSQPVEDFKKKKLKVIKFLPEEIGEGGKKMHSQQ